jgi:hypothetical protein
MSKIEQAGNRKYPDNFPPKEFWIEPATVDSGLVEFAGLVEGRSGEKAIDECLKENRGLLARFMNFTQFGHHGTWVVPQQQVRPPLTTSQRGLKPDYIVGGKGSDGYKWFVVELKGADQNIFTERNGNVVFSNAVNDGICQLLNYVDYCSSAQAYLRDTLRLNDFREPEGCLIVGREDELSEDPRKQSLKAAWNRLSGGRLQLRTYDAFIRSTASSWASEING